MGCFFHCGQADPAHLRLIYLTGEVQQLRRLRTRYAPHHVLMPVETCSRVGIAGLC